MPFRVLRGKARLTEVNVFPGKLETLTQYLQMTAVPPCPWNSGTPGHAQLQSQNVRVLPKNGIVLAYELYLSI